MSSSPHARSSQRTVLACTECVRRKVRCSKTVPCEGCVRLDKANDCRREEVAVTTRRRPRAAALRARRNEIKQTSDKLLPSFDDSSHPTLTSTPGGRAHERASPPRPLSNDPPRASLHNAIPAESTISHASNLDYPSSGPLTDDSASALEFLAHGRQNAIRRFRSANYQTPSTSAGVAADEMSFDSFFPVELCENILLMHEKHLAWMHSVIHMPTFRGDFVVSMLTGNCDKSWAALYFAIIAHSSYHFQGTSLLPGDFLDYPPCHFFDKSVDMLFQGNFMSEHKIESVQAICLLLQVAHNLDKSDLICILVSAAIRISQCLNLHLLGSDVSFSSAPKENEEIVDREIGKRIWWFLVRYDWLQIPFQNICQIQPSQFNTPMPLTCFDELDRMIKNGVVISQPDNVVTSTRWTIAMDQVSVLVWKHQDRMNRTHNQGNGPNTPEKVYEHVVWADREIKRLYAKWPIFMRELKGETVGDNVITKNSLPVVLMPGLALLCIAHKILGVHRQFQLSSFRDSRYAFTQMSCLAIVERALNAIQAWPDAPETLIVRRMWTTVTQVVSCSVALVFALLFKNENALLYDTHKIRELLAIATDFLRREEQASSIAARGSRLIGALADLERRSDDAGDIEAEMGNLVRQFAASDEGRGSTNFAETQQVVFPPLEQDFSDMFAGTGGTAFSEFFMDQDFLQM